MLVYRVPPGYQGTVALCRVRRCVFSVMMKGVVQALWLAMTTSAYLSMVSGAVSVVSGDW
jgi:hypothetical protein